MKHNFINAKIGGELYEKILKNQLETKEKCTLFGRDLLRLGLRLQLLLLSGC